MPECSSVAFVFEPSERTMIAAIWSTGLRPTLHFTQGGMALDLDYQRGIAHSQ